MLVIAFGLAGCGTPNQTSISPADSTAVVDAAIKSAEFEADSNVIKVYLEASGNILADGKPTSVSELDSSFLKLATRGGTVYYARDNPQDDPPAVYLEVVDLVFQHGLPIRFYTDKTFTEIAVMH